MQDENKYLLISPEGINKIVVGAVDEAIKKYGLQKSENPTKLFTKKELANKFGVTIQTINEWMRKGIISFIKINSRVFFKEEEIQKLLTDKTFRNGRSN